MSISKFADAAELQVESEPIHVGVGLRFGPENETLASGGPRPDLNGVRCKFSNRPEIYLIDMGVRRHIPNPSTYNNLFRSWNGVVVDNDIDEIPEGAPIDSGAVLSRGNQTPHVYLIDRGVKRHVTSPATMDKYHFRWDRVYVVPQNVIDGIPTGSAIY